MILYSANPNHDRFSEKAQNHFGCLWPFVGCENPSKGFLKEAYVLDPLLFVTGIVYYNTKKVIIQKERKKTKQTGGPDFGVSSPFFLPLHCIKIVENIKIKLIKNKRIVNISVKQIQGSKNISKIEVKKEENFFVQYLLQTKWKNEFQSWKN